MKGHYLSRFRCKTDSTQKMVIEVLRKRGFQVIPMHAVGKGFPDLIVARDRKMGLIEVKSENGRLTDTQTVFHSQWVGPSITVISTLNQALEFEL